MKGFCLCTSLNYNCITFFCFVLFFLKKKKHSNIHIKKDCMSHFMLFTRPMFLYTFRNTACLVPPQQFHIDIFIPGSETVELSVAVFGVAFSPPSVTEVIGTTFDALRAIASFTLRVHLSSLFSLFPCLLKDHRQTHYRTSLTTGLELELTVVTFCSENITLFTTYATAWVQ